MTQRLSSRCAGGRARPPDVYALLIEPDIEFAGVEPHELANFEEWNPPLGHEAPDMPVRHSQSRDAVDVQQWVSRVRPGNWSTSCV